VDLITDEEYVLCEVKGRIFIIHTVCYLRVISWGWRNS